MENGDVRIILDARHFRATIDVSGLRRTRAFAEDPESGKYLEVLLKEKIELGLMEFNIMSALTATNDMDLIYRLRDRLDKSYEDRMKIIREFSDMLYGGSGALHKQS